ncbi:MAG: hypothetical protein AAAB36_22095 [Ensifer adhaerens]|uniref:hypothetical protein n=1 Tax=Ensifer sp. Root127 TaxID=1736440 RepID=UPI0012E33E9A|nr:hypothetical protein [Ensifer sp. Root127]MDP9630385.1 hypothetical protein [Ensifer adhaerens]
MIFCMTVAPLGGGLPKDERKADVPTGDPDFFLKALSGRNRPAGKGGEGTQAFII